MEEFKSEPVPFYVESHPNNRFHEEIDLKIQGIVNKYPGCTSLNILGSVVSELSYRPEFNGLLTAEILRSRLNYLSEKGEIVQLESINGAETERESTYYPSAYKFKATPRTQFCSQEKPPAKLYQPIHPEHDKIFRAMLTMIEATDNHIRLRIVHHFCNRCGEVREGHFCND